MTLCFSFCWFNHRGHLYWTSSYSKSYSLAILGMKSWKKYICLCKIYCNIHVLQKLPKPNTSTSIHLSICVAYLERGWKIILQKPEFHLGFCVFQDTKHHYSVNKKRWYTHVHEDTKGCLFASSFISFLCEFSSHSKSTTASAQLSHYLISLSYISPEAREKIFNTFSSVSSFGLNEL